MKRPYFVIADADTVLGFRCVGVDGVAVSDRQAAQDALQNAVSQGVSVVLLSEEAADLVRERVDELMLKEEQTLIVEIPGPRGSLPGRRTMADLIGQAIGVKV